MNYGKESLFRHLAGLAIIAYPYNIFILVFGELIAVSQYQHPLSSRYPTLRLMTKIRT